jgi:hypothetical protein
MKIKAGFVIYAGWYDDMDDAKDFIKRHGLTSDDVSLRHNQETDSVYITAKREIELCKSPKS